MRGLLNVGGGVVFGRWLTGCVRDAAADYVKQRLLSGEYYEEEWEVNEISPLQDRLLPVLVLRCAQHLLSWGSRMRDCSSMPLVRFLGLGSSAYL